MEELGDESCCYVEGCLIIYHGKRKTMGWERRLKGGHMIPGGMMHG